MSELSRWADNRHGVERRPRTAARMLHQTRVADAEGVRPQFGKALRRLAIATVTLMAAALPVTLSGPPAQAAVSAYATTRFIGGGTTVNVRTSPAIASGNVAYTVGSGAAISIDCQLVGGRLGFSQYADNRTWNPLTNGRYIHDAVTTTPADQGRIYLPDGGYVRYSSNIPRCGGTVSSRESRAVAWVQSQLGVRYTSSTPDGMWSGWCEAFVEIAFGTRYRYGSAIANYNAQRAAGRVRTDTNPPRGVLVFYSWGTYGHVGISLGGGQVISTQGYSTPLPVRQHSVTGVGLPYLGWAYAPADWPGR